MHKLVRMTAMAAAILLMIAGCTTTLTVNAKAVDAAVEVRPSSGDPKPIKTNAPVAVGDTVSTDSGGLSEVVFADKSLARLGPDSKLTIVALSDAKAQRTVTKVDVGESWHRVKKLTADGSKYQVQTPVGTASVRGTAFAVVCSTIDSCAFTVIEGLVQVKTKDGTTIDVHPFEKLTLPGDTASVPYPVDAVNADEWIMKNLKLDGSQLADAVAAAGSASNWNAAINGPWNLALTITSETAPNRQQNVGTVSTRVWAMTMGECSAGSCHIAIKSSSGTTIPGTLSSTGFAVNPADGLAGCINNETGLTLSEQGYSTHVEYTLTPDRVGTVDGVPTIMSFSGTFTSVYTLADSVACIGAPVSATTVASVSLVRAKG